MNWVDYLILLIFFLFALDGLGKSLLMEILSLVSFLSAFILSLNFYNYVAQFFEKVFSLPISIAAVLGFILAWYLVEVLFFIILQLFLGDLMNRLKIPMGNILAIVPSFLKGLVFVAVILILVATFPVQPTMKKAVQDSLLGSSILDRASGLETPLKNIFGGLSDETFSFLTVHPSSNESVNLGFKTNNFYFDQNIEQQMFVLVNQERVSRGLPALSWDTDLQKIARIHSADMMQRGYFSHYTPEGQDVAGRAESQSIPYMVIGENLAYAPSLQLAHQGLMNSPGHRANILSPEYHKIGIGVANGYEYGLMFTQVFTN
ncbi:CvpA family protein [Patescibacteria group bacterium]|nr:CvpA family protein [Patescibacteria group bacterium]MCL5409598.1 CvpA family protein [Patescibacteria group bacterium]